MDHSAHEPGTVAECPGCRALAYEPGWYRAIQRERPSEGAVVIPEADGIHLEVLLPDLERSRPDDDDR